MVRKRIRPPINQPIPEYNEYEERRSASLPFVAFISIHLTLSFYLFVVICAGFSDSQNAPALIPFIVQWHIFALLSLPVSYVVFKLQKTPGGIFLFFITLAFVAWASRMFLAASLDRILIWAASSNIGISM